MTHLSLQKIITLTLFYIVFSTASVAQDLAKSKSDFWQNVQFGGSLGLNFGNGFFAGNIAPVALYRFSPYVSAGVGLNFGYTSERDFYDSFNLGMSALALFNPIREIQISTEFQQSYVNRTFDDRTPFSDDKYWVPALFLGLGYTYK